MRWPDSSERNFTRRGNLVWWTCRQWLNSSLVNSIQRERSVWWTRKQWLKTNTGNAKRGWHAVWVLRTYWMYSAIISYALQWNLFVLKTKATLIFNKRSYKVSGSIAIMSRKMNLLNSAFYASARPKIIREDFLQAKWLPFTQGNNRRSLKRETTEKVNVIGTMTLHVRMGLSSVRVLFAVVGSLEVIGLLRTSFFEIFVKGIMRFPT